MAQLLRKNKTIHLVTIFFIALLIILLLSWLYIFNIYEVQIEKKETSSLNYVVDIFPLNSLGFRAPLRKVVYTLKVTEGEENLENLFDSEDGEIKIELKNLLSKVKLQIETDKTQNISLIEIP